MTWHNQVYIYPCDNVYQSFNFSNFISNSHLLNNLKFDVIYLIRHRIRIEGSWK